jgi:hypothetical protein
VPSIIDNSNIKNWVNWIVKGILKALLLVIQIGPAIAGVRE